MRITKDLLKESGLYFPEFDLEFPDGCDVIVANFLDPERLTFDLDGLVKKLAPGTVLAEYVEATRAAWAQYDAATAQAEVEYQRNIAIAQDHQPALVKYTEATLAALECYNIALAQAAVTALLH